MHPRLRLVPLTNRLSVLIVIANPRSFSSVTGCSAMESAIPVCRFEEGQTSNGIWRSRT